MAGPAADSSGAHAVRLLAAGAYFGYDFGDDHPLSPRRLEVGLDLLRQTGLLRPEDEWAPPAATDAELCLAHDPSYVEALARLSLWAPLHDAPLEAEARRYGLGHGDTPIFPGAHAAAAAIAGGSLHAVRAMLRGDLAHAFHPMGGLHHAQRARAAGFCLINDPAVAIAAAVEEHGARVLYLDFDVHHGDGVQARFEDDPRVMTVSFHESGRFLFPGTGDEDERGRGAGEGSVLNVPFAPGTEDGDWIAALDTLLPPVAAAFRPDLVVSQHGCDTHAYDPLADLRLSTASFQRQAQVAHRLAHRHAGGRWLATGGGGYDLYRVVPRSWAIVWSEMTGRPLPHEVPAAWHARWQPEAPSPLPHTMLDGPEDVPPAPAGAAAHVQNAATLERVRRYTAR